ncbi:UvrD-helicase domain-containing protein [Endozoicomonas sp. ONNA1]|uniref:UvrD-helicase domain-containing protein n=1 Tax=Endozoicomonas sp. ONNA1 TaxID=2828740 RepID=UPI002148D529|nr:UvrD-helicase domain-containing protein [Endozoicomonas sp. ONNA1]
MITITDQDIDQLQKETGLTFDAARREALKSYTDVQACPGSGKTTLVSAKLILLAKKWREEHRGICVLSHTNVAKDEIIERLKGHTQGRVLLGYPHFIGTIQEFVNKFLGIPYCRSKGIPVNSIDDDICTSFIERNLHWKTKVFLKQRYADAADLKYFFEAGDLVLKVPGFNKPSTSVSYQDLNSIKQRLHENGYHFYREMYEYGKAGINQNPGTAAAIRYRFPITFIDEMQDTSLFQDEVINSIFGEGDSQLQRFGDPDQSIFEGSDTPNTSYNDAELDAICNSHRFSPAIATLSSGLSYQGISIQSSHTTDKLYPNTVFLVDEQSRQAAIPAFAKLCCENVPVPACASFKAVGAIGIEKPEGLTIPHYFPNFDKSKSSRRFRPARFIDYFLHNGGSAISHSGAAYRSVLDGIVHYARLSQQKITMPEAAEQVCTTETIRQYLKATGKKHDFNKLYLNIINSGFQDAERWQQGSSNLLRLAGLRAPSGGSLDFLGYIPPDSLHEEDGTSKGNVYRYREGDHVIDVEVATIHSVKGETHAATLVFETKFGKSYDIHSLLDYLLKNQSRQVTAVQKKKFMKQLYVAMTRPKYLLCLAMDKGRFTSQYKSQAEALGWTVVDLT